MDARTPARSLGPWPVLAALLAVTTVVATLAAAWDGIGRVAGWNAAFTAAAGCALAGTQFDPTVVDAFLGTLRRPQARPRLGAIT